MAGLIGGPYHGRILQLPQPQPKTVLMPLLHPPTYAIYIKTADSNYKYQGDQK